MMKKFKSVLMFSFVLAFGFCFINGVSAATISSGSFKASLKCPTRANTNETITCDISASSTDDTAIEKVTFSNLTNVSIISKSIDNNYVNGGNIEIYVGSVKLKVGSGNSDATISVKIVPSASGLQPSKVTKPISIVSSVNTLKSLKVDGVLIRGFAPDISSYSLNTKNKTINVSASASSSLANVTGTGLKNLSCGNNTFNIVVKAQSGSKKVYSLNIKRECSSNVYLSGIVLSTGELSPSFNKSITSYEVQLGKDVKKISITGKKGESNQTITGNVKDKELKLGSNKINLTVSDSSGEKTVYTINVIRGSDKDSNTFLSALALSSGNITFNKNNFEYETKVLYSVRNIEVSATTESKTSKYTVVGGDGLVVGENIVKVTVTAQSGDTKDYIIKVTRLKEGESFGDNANIKSINIEGYNLHFQYNKTNYKLVIGDEDSLNINVIMDDVNSTYRILGNSNLKDDSVIEIVTTSADGTSKTYYINIVKKSSVPYVIISVILIGLALAGVAYAYFRYVRSKNIALDVNGNRIDKNEDEGSYRRVMVTPQNSLTKNAAAMNNLDPNSGVNVNGNQQQNVQQPQNIQQSQNAPMNPNNVASTSSNMCPSCGRELLGTPEVCPYCNTKLR